MNYKGVIIEESLSDKSVLDKLKIDKTEVEPVTSEHKTPWLKQWTLHTVLISDKSADTVAREISEALDYTHGTSWYADFKNKTTHYIVFKNRIFKIDRNKKEEYQKAIDYGISLGIPDYQVDFAPFATEWKWNC